MRETYIWDEDIRHSLPTDLENAFRYDRTQNGNYFWNLCGLCNGLKFRHKEKCCHSSGGYTKEVMEGFENVILDIEGVRQEIVKYVEKNDVEKRLFIIHMNWN